MTAEELIAALEQQQADGDLDMDCDVTLVIAGRWTGIKSVTSEDGVAYIESAD